MATIFWLSIDFFSRKLSDLHSTCPENHLVGKFVLEILLSFSHIERIFFGLLSKIFGGLVKTALYVFREPFWGGKKFENLWFLIGFGFWAKCFRLRLEISLNRIFKFEISILRVQRNALKNVFFWKIYVFVHLWRLSEIYWPSGKLFEHGCQNGFRRVHKNTLRKTILLNRKFSCFHNSWTLSENLSTVWGSF